jgi:predicted NUDIX family NTP pyrophosphohydrolase
VDEVRWFDLGAARARINPAQTAMLDELEGIVAGE